MSDLQHADWAPSAMSRILTCAGSVELSKCYPKENTDASDKGGEAHQVLEDCIVLGIAPEHEDPGIMDGVQLALDYLDEKTQEYGPDCQVYAEKRLAIPDTPVWGTTDTVIVARNTLHIIDYKHGYLPVEVSMNAQLLCYLIGAIAEFGHKKKYLISIIQPNYDHIDGPIRTYEVTEADIEWFMGKLRWAMAHPNEFKPTRLCCRWCPARGECKYLAGWIAPKLNTYMEYELTERHVVSDDTMSKLLDFADLANGWAKELRSAAYRRAMQDRVLGGWKIVQGPRDRVLDLSAAKVAYSELGISEGALYEAKPISAKKAEDQVKSTYPARTKEDKAARAAALTRLEEAISTTRGSPSLVRANDGRPVFKRGMEFSELPVFADDEEAII